MSILNRVPNKTMGFITFNVHRSSAVEIDRIVESSEYKCPSHFVRTAATLLLDRVHEDPDCVALFPRDKFKVKTEYSKKMSVYISKATLAEISQLVKSGHFSSRAVFMRIAVQSLLDHEFLPHRQIKIHRL